jgi:hypothetical protein
MSINVDLTTTTVVIMSASVIAFMLIALFAGRRK